MLEPLSSAFTIKVASSTEGYPMRFAKNGWFVLGCLLVAGLIQSATTGQAPTNPIPPNFGEEFVPEVAPPKQSAAAAQLTASASAEGMMAFASTSPGGGQVVTVVDAQQKWMAVYSVDVVGGRIKLLSSRPLRQDFSIEYNVAEPTPADIQKLQNP